MVPADRATPPRTDGIRYLEQHAGSQRIAGVNLALPPDVPTMFGLHDARGYDAPQPSLRFFRLWQLASPRQEGWQPLDVRQLSPTALNVLSLLGARLIVLEPSDRSQPLGLRQVYDGPDARIVRNPRALPRVFIAPSVRVVADERAALTAIATPGFNPRRTAIVERGAPRVPALDRTLAMLSRAHVTQDDNARVAITATLLRRSLVVLDDNLAPGWSVSVDDRSAPIVRVDSVLRGVVVPAGTHTVTWSYTVPGLHAGLALSGVGAIALLGWGLVLLRLRSRPQATSEPAATESQPPRRRRR